MIGKKFAQLRLVVLTVSMLLIQLVAFSQNLISVSFINGAIGTKGNNVRDLSNATNFSTLQITKSYFIQNSSVSTFQVQGNAVTGTLRLVTATNAFVDVPGAMEWSDNGGVKEFVGFIPSSNLVSFNLNTYGGSNYVIDNTKNFALVYNSSSLSFTNGSSITGNSSNPLSALNAYLTSFNASRPAGPVTVTSQTTSSSNPTITGTATLGSGESLSIEFNGVVYTSGITRPTSTTWSWTVPNSVTLTAGTYNVVATITNAGGYTLSDATTNELVVSSTNFANLGCITIVASGGDALGTTWTYANNTISPTGSTAVNLNASDVVTNLAAGNLTIASPCITINANVIGGSHTNALYLNSNKITQVAGVSVTTQGGNITYSATNSPQTNGVDQGISIGATTGSRSVVNANGGNISMTASFASTGTVGGAGGDRTIFLGTADILTSSTGTINLTGDATNSVNAASTTFHAWGFDIGDSRIQTAAGAITITGTGGKLTPNSRGIVLWDLSLAGVPKILSASGQITIIDQKPDGLTGTGVYNGLYLRPISTADFWIGADGTNVATSSSNVILRSDKISVVNESSKFVKFNTSGTVLFESVGTSFETEPTLSGLSLGSTVSGFTLGKTTNTSNLTLNSATTIAGPVSVYGGAITVDANINTSAGNANGDILLKATGNIIQGASKTITTSGGDVTLWSDSDGNGTGYIQASASSSISSGGGNVVFGGGLNLATGYARGAATVDVASGSFSYISGVHLMLGTSITSAGGNITLRGQNIGTSFGTVQAGIMGMNTTLNAGSGKVSLFGIAGGSSSANAQGISVKDISTGWTIRSSNPDSDAISLVGDASSTSNSYTSLGINFIGTIESTGGGGVILNGKAGTASSYDHGLDVRGNVLADAGAITLIGQNDVASDIGTFLDASSSIGFKAATNVTSSSSNIILKSDNTNFNTATNLNTTGTVSIVPLDASSSFGVAQTLGSNTILSAGVSGLTIGKSSNTSGITIGSATTIAGPVSLFGGAIAINAAVTATNNTLSLNASGAVTQTGAIVANNLALNGTGTFTLNNANNNIATIAAGDNTTRVGNISLTDASGGLTIGTVGNTAGINSTGTVLVETLVGDLTLSGNISTTNTTANAIVINAGKSTAIGTVTGGNILVTGTPTLTTGTGGITKLFSGSDAGSTGLTTLVGGAANTRNGIDETSTTYSPSLVANGKYALYRTALQTVAPVITSFSPTTAGNGETVVITGTGFAGVNVVKFGNVNATSFVVNSSTQITAVVGAAASGDVLVQNSAGSDTEPGFIFKVVELKFEGNTLDQTAADRDGTVVGTATYGPGASGQAICFTNNNVVNGTTVQNYLRLPNDLIRGRGENFTISLRFKTASYGAILGYQNADVGNVSQYVPILYVQSDGKLSANLWQASNQPLNVLSSNRVDDNNWHKVEFSASAGSITVYIDGVSAGTSNGTIAHLSMSFNQIGAVNTAGVWTGDPIDGWFGFNGCIDEFMIIDRSLTATQIQQVTQLPLPTITSFTPTTAKSGETVTITGTNFGSASSVKLGGVEARRFTIVSATEIRAIVPFNATVNSTVQVTTAAGTISGTTFTYDCNSNALDFDATNDHVVVGDVIENLGAFSQEAWVYWKGSTLDYSEIFTKEAISAFAITNTNKLHANFGNGTSWGAGVNSTTSIPLNTWTHVAVTRSSSGAVKLYINGVLDASTATLSLTGQNTSPRVIGGKLVGPTLFGPFKGSIDELKAWNTERTAQQIITGMGTELIGNESGLIAYYNFNQGIAAGSNTTITTLNNLTAVTILDGTLTNISLSGAASNFVQGVWPVITSQPASSTSVCTSTGGSLSVTAFGPQLTYQWYSNSTASNAGGTAINGATTATLSIPVSSTGTYYYYVVLTGACSQTVTSTVSTVVITSTPSLIYTSTHSFDRGATIAAINPTVTGGSIASYSISPALPAGLSLNANTGVITGTPTVFTPATIYTITGTVTGCGSATSTLTISVTDPTCTSFAAADFQINNNASYSNNVYTLTPNQGAQNGSVWNKTRLFLDQNFDISGRVYLGNSDAGADGIAFVLQNQSLNAGSSGGGLGYAGITPSFAVEFDTYNNGSHEPSQDHLAIIANGNAAGVHNTYSTPYEVQMEDGQWHTVRFVWDAASKNLQVWYDGTRRHNITIDLKANIFNGAPYVYWGFTGATGGATNLQQVQFDTYCYVQQVGVTALAGTNNTNAALSFCEGATVRLQATASTSYQWFKNGTALTGETGRELVVSTSGAYTVQAVTNQNTTLSEVVNVNVTLLPVITYASNYSFERTRAITAMTPTVSGGTPTSYAITPALPTGLTFNTTNGSISGTPSVVSASATYTVTGTTASGCVGTTTFTLNVFNAVAPSALSFAPGSQTVRQGTAITNMVPTASGGSVASYSISPALPAGLSFNTTTGIISGTLTAQQTGTVTYTITATNSGGSTTATVTLVYNTAPTDVALSSTSVAENTASGTAVASLSATDADAGDTHTYTLVSGTGDTDNASFTITGSTLSTAAVFDFETKSSYSVRVRVTDAGGLSFEKAFTIDVTNVNEVPTNISASASSVAENAASGTTVGTLAGTDADAGDTHTYTLVSGTGDTDNASFTITGSTLSTAAVFDFETKSSYSVRVRVTDAGGLTFEKVFTISVTDVNEAPTALALSNASVLENAASGTTVGTLAGTDADAGDTHTYTLVSGTGSTDNASFTITGTTLSTAAVFNFEAKNSYSVRVRVTDAGGLSFERAFTISVTDVNEAPTLTAITDRRVYNVSTSQVVNLAGITAGPETAQSTTTIVSTDKPATFSSISVVGTQIQFTLAPGIVTPQDVVVTVRVKDNGGVANGGVDSVVRTFRLGVDPMPVASASPNLITLGATAQLSAAGANAVNYTWVAVGGSGIVGSGATINVRPKGTTTYAVVVTNSFGYQATVPVLLTVIVDYKLVPNNLVTPNGDGVNDKWVIPNIDMYPDNEVMVYDKAGRAVFAKRGYNNEWDGTVNGKLLKEDAYFYVIKFNKDGALPIRGYVSIVR